MTLPGFGPTTKDLVRAAARAWRETMKSRKQLSDDKYENPVRGWDIDTAFVDEFLGNFVAEVGKL